MTALEPGKTVLFFRQDKLLTGLLLNAGDGRWSVLDALGDTHLLASDRFVLISLSCIASPSLQSLTDFVQGLESAQRSLPEQLIIERLVSLPDNFSFDQAFTAIGYTDDLHIFALYTWMNARKDLFLNRKGTYRLRSAEERVQYQQDLCENEERQKYLRGVQELLQSFTDGKDIVPDSNLRSKLSAELRSGILGSGQRDIHQLLLHWQTEQTLEAKIRSLRIYLGDIDSETDPIVADSGLPIAFAAGLALQIQDAVEYPESGISAFTVDAEGTPDHDDAISLEITDTGYRLGVHISAVAARIPRNSALYEEARERVSSLYLPGSTVPMLPEELTSWEFSLKQGSSRPVLSLMLELDRGFNILSWEFKRQSITIESNLRYSEVDSSIGEEPYHLLHKLCRQYHHERTGGQKERKIPYSWYVKVQNGKVQMQRINNLSPSRFIIEELMILYNRLMAEQASRSALPLIYRNITQFGDPDDEDAPNLGTQAYLSTDGKFHPGIGASAYAHASSPIRRFADTMVFSGSLAAASLASWPTLRAPSSK